MLINAALIKLSLSITDYFKTYFSHLNSEIDYWYGIDIFKTVIYFYKLSTGNVIYINHYQIIR